MLYSVTEINLTYKIAENRHLAMMSLTEKQHMRTRRYFGSLSMLLGVQKFAPCGKDILRTERMLEKVLQFPVENYCFQLCLTF